jgi:branched-chain amino acid transport system permease protein
MQAIIVGIALGFLYGLVGLSLTMVYNSTKVINFAFGDFFMLGAVLTGYFVSLWDFWLVPSLIVIYILLVLLSIVVYRVLVGPLLKSGGIQSALLSTLILGLMIGNVAGLVTRNRPINVEPFINMNAIFLGPAIIQPQYLFLVGSAVLFILAYWFFLHRTRWGIAFRAIGLDPEAGKIIGIKNVPMITLSFAIGGFVAAFGGSMYAPVSTPLATMGVPLTINGFVAAVIGGMDHPFGSIVGGLIVGLTYSFLTAYTTSIIAEISTFAILIVILVLRPQGIFAEKE